MFSRKLKQLGKFRVAMVSFREIKRYKKMAIRETKYWKEKFTELETENLRMKHQTALENVEIQRAMEVYQIQYDGLCMQLEVKEMDIEDLLFRKFVVDGELKAYQITIDGLIQRIASLEEDGKVVLRAQERENYLEPMTENRVLMCGETRTECEIQVLRKRVQELESQSGLRRKQVVVELKKELEAYRTKCDWLFVKLEHKKKGFAVIEGKYKDLMSRKVDVDNKLRQYKEVCEAMKERISRLNEDRKGKRESDKRVQERMAYLEKELQKKENNEREKNAELIAVNRALESGKEKAEAEIEVLIKRIGELEKGQLDEELEACGSKNPGLSVELKENKMERLVIEGKFKDLMSKKIAVDDKLKACYKTCKGLKELIKDLEEDQKDLFEKEKWAQDRITNLEEELKNIRSDGGENYFELIIKNKDLECAKRSAEEEYEIWKKRFRDMETRALRMEQVELEKAEVEKEFEILMTKYSELSMELQENKIGCVGVEDKEMCNELREQIMGLEENLKVISENEKSAQERITYLEDEIRIWKKNFRELETKVLKLVDEISTLRCVDSQVSGGLQSEVSYNDKGKKYNRNTEIQSDTYGVTDAAHVAHLKIKEKMLNNHEKILTSSVAGCNHPSSIQGNIDVHITGPASIIMQSRHLLNVKEEQKNTPLESKVEFGSVRPASVGIVGISDHKDKKVITPMHTCNVRGKEMLCVSTDNTLKRSWDNEKDLQSKKRLKRSCSDLKGEEYWSSYENDIPLCSALKRTASKAVTSEIEGEDDDKIPNSTLKMTKTEKLNEGVHEVSPLNLSGGNATVSSRGQNVDESLTPSRGRLISLSQCEAENNCRKGASLNENASPSRSQMCGNSSQNAGNPSAENRKQNMAIDVFDSHTEGEYNLKSDSSDSGESLSDSKDATDISSSLDQVIAMLKRNREKESKWKFEADMLSSFDEDPELCMKAVCALYRQQISDGKSMKGSLHSSSRGFKEYDALRATTLAEFLMDGDRKGDLKKSVKDLEIFDSKAPEECKRLASLYSEQLFNIYQNKEDPFFLPNGI